MSYEAYNESDVLIGAVERYAKREGHYPERAFALTKHTRGLGRITARLDATTRNAIAKSVLAMNVDRITAKRVKLLLRAVFFEAENAIIRLRETMNGSGCRCAVAC